MQIKIFFNILSTYYLIITYLNLLLQLRSSRNNISTPQRQGGKVCITPQPPQAICRITLCMLFFFELKSTNF